EDVTDQGKDVLARIRSSGALQPATLRVGAGGTTTVDLAEGEDGVSPGQACVFYAADGRGERLLGGGWIRSADGAKVMAEGGARAGAAAGRRETLMAGPR
ncbi:MAG: aminomethyltransferase beta-barrel domain-containing protein, partial [Methyloceanibacter sp.]